ncbi:amidohydrolase family protein [Streptomyces sp. AS02]|uniref:amidohydrolase family protein n=1 Tax=Streptomyces sp. AS02 TaxID=2938946 RepID=UPI0020201AA9|nr:amidohydrolase family protein [Streptomyces sp. AS02]MCL8015638.1 amidohydrolase family protein [Streptomyces sp. AS02]
MLYMKTYVDYPRIRWIGAHAGGTLPFLSYRTGLLYSKTVGLAQALGLDGLDGLDWLDWLDWLDDANVLYRRLFFDTTLSPAPQPMKSTKELAGAGHIMFASDRPFAAELFPLTGDPAPQLGETFTGEERLRVERTNALGQLPRVGARLKG